MNLGVYCETLAPQALAARDVVALLGRNQVTLAHAVRFTADDGRFDPAQLFPHLDLGAKLRAQGGRYALWPLLPKSMGYWVNERNLVAVDRLVDTLLEGFRRHGTAPDHVVMDVETPWTQMERTVFPGTPPVRRLLSAVRFALENRNARRFAWSCEKLGQIVARMQRTGVAVSAAVFPLLLADLEAGGDLLQDLLEMPIFGVAYDAYNAMLYNSYLPEALPFLVPREAATRFLFEYAQLLAQRFGERAWVTLGSTWEGVIPGNEGKAYGRATDLAADVAAAKAAGVSTLWLYCLEGVLFADQPLTTRRPLADSQAFFDVLRDTPPAEPPPHDGWTRRRRLLRAVAGLRRRFFHST
jgi:hypothetical protein